MADDDQGDDVPVTPQHPGMANLRPFRRNDERTRAAARRSVAVREARRAVARADSEAVAEHLRRLTAVHERDRLGDEAAACAADVIGRIAAGEIPVRNGDEAASLLRVLVDIARLESGLPTSATATLHLGSTAAVERVRALQAEARAVLGPVDVEHEGDE